MNVRIGSQKLKLEDADLVGQGGEARVYRWGDRAVKIYHPVADVARKLAKIAAFPTGLPSQVVAPLELVSDARGKPVGFTMRRIDAAEDLLRLGQRSFREGLIDNRGVVGLFARLRQVVDEVHRRGVVIGDFNDGNVLFTGDNAGLAPWLIDADSMQFGAFVCEVGHERFLDPRLYGVDLSSRPAFSAETDWYAFSVLLFASLLYVHPYGGLHKTLPTLLRRAEARHSILRDDVVVPRAAVHWRVLPDELLEHFSRVFDRDQRPTVEPRLLDLRWSRCSCGLEHARVVCPACASLGVVAGRAALRISGQCTGRTVVRTHGRILAAGVRGGIQYLVEEDGVIRRENRAIVLTEPRRPGMRFVLAGDSTWVGLGRELLRIRDGKVLERTVTGTFAGQPSFAASAAGLHRLDGDWLMENDLRVGPVLGGQTFVAGGERLGVGFYRAGLVTKWFLFRRGQPGLLQLELPTLDGKLVDLDCVFDEAHALICVATEKEGRRTHRLHLVDDQGRERARASGAPDSARFLASVRGKALDGGRIACLTDEGVLSLAVEDQPNAPGRIGEGRIYSDTAPFSAADAQLLRGPGGSLFVVSTREIVQMTLSGGK